MKSRSMYNNTLLNLEDQFSVFVELHENYAEIEVHDSMDFYDVIRFDIDEFRDHVAEHFPKDEYPSYWDEYWFQNFEIVCENYDDVIKDVINENCSMRPVTIDEFMSWDHNDHRASHLEGWLFETSKISMANAPKWVIDALLFDREYPMYAGIPHSTLSSFHHFLSWYRKYKNETSEKNLDLKLRRELVQL